MNDRRAQRRARVVAALFAVAATVLGIWATIEAVRVHAAPEHQVLALLGSLAAWAVAIAVVILMASI